MEEDPVGGLIGGREGRRVCQVETRRTGGVAHPGDDLVARGEQQVGDGGTLASETAPENSGANHSRNGTTNSPARYSTARRPRGRVADSHAPMPRPIAVNMTGANSG